MARQTVAKAEKKYELAEKMGQEHSYYRAFTTFVRRRDSPYIGSHDLRYILVLRQ